MLTIRLTRKGRKNQPFYNVVVVDKRRSAKGGRAVEILGFVDPMAKRRSLKADRVLHWIKMGAQPSPTVHNLLVTEKIVDAKKVAKHKNSPKPAEAAVPAGSAPVTPEAPAPEAPKAEETPAEPEKTA